MIQLLCSDSMTSVSRGLVLAAAMVLSSTLIYLAFSRKIIPPRPCISGNSDSRDSDKQILQPCLCSKENKVDGKKEKKKKKVKFADNVMEANDEAENEQRKQNRVARSCRDEIEGMMGVPANRIALYNGILKDRVRKMECS
ncbi:uncharacterized protein LOC129287613 [Prosopis cineraria]|uniref:uncharacterized protein LOC129287613 n=1 Tax=Prosopis cineraria TaxID=364024 RepID=UPI00240F2D7B|nr:uncharacterized protein LOC129287613 [Prosopis cineraria]